MFESKKTVKCFQDDGNKVLIPGENDLPSTAKAKRAWNKSFKWAMSFAMSFVLIFSFFVFPLLSDNGAGFSIVAYAAEGSGDKPSVTLAEKTSAELPWGKLTRSADGSTLDYSMTQFKIDGKNIESVTLTSHNGYLFYSDLDLFEVELNNIAFGDPVEGENFKIDSANPEDVQTGKTITVQAKESSNIRFMWTPSNEELHKIINGGSIGDLKDTMELIVKTKDGETSVKKIVLSFSENGTLHAELVD